MRRSQRGVQLQGEHLAHKVIAALQAQDEFSVKKRKKNNRERDHNEVSSK
jgi:hypothetical protein